MEQLQFPPQFVPKEHTKESRLTVAMGVLAMVVVLALLGTLILNLARQSRARERVHQAAVTMRSAVEEMHVMVQHDDRQRHWVWECFDDRWTMSRLTEQSFEVISTVMLPAGIQCEQSEPLVMKSGTGRVARAVSVNVVGESAQFTVRVTPQSLVSLAEATQ